MTLTHSIVPMAGELPFASCDTVRLRAVIDDLARWRSRVGCLLAAGRRRWLGRTELDSCPALGRWNRIQPLRRPAGHPTLSGAVAAAAAGVRIPGTDLTEFATAIMLLSGCPATVTGTVCGGIPDRPPAITVSLFAFPADDLALAQDLAAAAIATTGTVTFRYETTVVLAPQLPPSDRTRRDPPRDFPVREPEGIGPARAPAGRDNVGM